MGLILFMTMFTGTCQQDLCPAGLELGLCDMLDHVSQVYGPLCRLEGAPGSLVHVPSRRWT
jgi:hypothetical protein